MVNTYVTCCTDGIAPSRVDGRTHDTILALKARHESRIQPNGAISSYKLMGLRLRTEHSFCVRVLVAAADIFAASGVARSFPGLHDTIAMHRSMYRYNVPVWKLHFQTITQKASVSDTIGLLTIQHFDKSPGHAMVRLIEKGCKIMMGSPDSDTGLASTRPGYFTHGNIHHLHNTPTRLSHPVAASTPCCSHILHIHLSCMLSHYLLLSSHSIDSKIN